MYRILIKADSYEFRLNKRSGSYLKENGMVCMKAKGYIMQTKTGWLHYLLKIYKYDERE